MQHLLEKDYFTIVVVTITDKVSKLEGDIL